MNKREFTVENEYQYNYKSHVWWLSSHLFRNKYYLLGFSITCILVALLNVEIAKITGNAFDFVLGNSGSNTELLKKALFILLAYFFKMMIKSLNYFFIEVTASRVERNTRDELYLNLLGKSQTFHNRHRAGDIMASAGNDVQFLNGMTNPGISNIINGFVNILIPVIFIVNINYKLLLVPCIYECIFFFFLKSYTKKFFSVAREATDSFACLSADLTETLGGVNVVQASGQEQKEIDKFLKNINRNCDASIQKGRCQASYLPPLFFGVALVLSFIHSLTLVQQGEISIGDIIYYLSLLTAINSYSTTFVDCISRMQIGMSAAKRIYNLIVTDTEVDENTDGYSGEIKGNIKFENVSFGYGERKILRNIDFEIKSGETIAVVGQTGTGKSTLAKLINRTYDVSEGNILIDGINIKDWELKELRTQISVVEQEINLFSQTVAQNISFNMTSVEENPKIVEAAKMAKADEFIKMLPDGYNTKLGEQGATLSGGQRQRIALARTIYAEPKIVILDDSTSAIDSSTEAEIQEVFSHVLKGRTTILITHRLAQIKGADRIIMLEKGEISAIGAHDELMKSCETYRKIFSC